ncbi:SPOR domain-containing protein [Pseudoalteromonas tunicata]|uniref:SPOR domain-containing protein n=1 Tax=Pseudoalteromonas tunicata TaxID=314281 RepID=UPI00273FE377|nr:SPOR domain-containing protein [Pseudoalteromonas tunicata]MDP4985613.1 hypothetical protein [Pseudoalteromonas tunicata]
MIDKLQHIKITVWLLFFGLILFNSPLAQAAAFKQITINEEQYILVDVEVRELTLLSDIEIYQHEDDFFVPYLPIVQALELENNARLNDGYIQARVGDTSVWVDFTKQTANLKSLEGDVLWSSNGFDLLISLKVLQAFLNATIEYEGSRLLIQITPKDEKYFFPIEKRMNRNNAERNERRIKQMTGEKRHFFTEQVLLDHYHLMTPPSGSAALSLYTGDNQNLNYNLSTSLSGDLLYHSAVLSLNKAKDRDIRANLRFSGAPKDPYEIMPLDIGYYDFGDVSASGTGGSSGGQGVGFTLRSSERDFSRNFGSTVIEGLATPGWEAELYTDGFFIAQQTVSEQGLYKFENVITEYGVNTFKVKLFGPFGEEEERVETIEIKGNWLKPGKSRFKGGMFESNEYLFHGALEDGYSPDKAYLGIDYGLTESHQLGLTLSGSDDFDGRFDKELKINLQSALYELLVDNEFTFENDVFRYEFSGQGRFSKNIRYNFDYSYNVFKATDNQPLELKSHFLAFRLSGSLKLGIPLSYGFRAGMIKDERETRLSSVSSRLSTNVGNTSVYNNVTYYLSSKDQADNYSGIFGWSGKVFDGRFNLETSYYYQDVFEVPTVRANFYKEFESGYSFNSRAEYNAEQKETETSAGRDDYWALSASISKSFEQFGLSGIFQYNSDDSWAVGVGINFSLGYDYINDELRISRGGLYGGGTLDLNAYLDRNSNGVLDENDLALSDVEFGPYQNWKQYKTNSSGRVVLQGVPGNRPVNFTGAWGNGISPSVSSYSLYTHSGGYIKADVPFTIKSDFVGYLYISTPDGENAIKEAPIELVNSEGQAIKISVTSHDGYYEFTGVNAGDYYIRVNSAFLNNRGLKSQPGIYHIPTPPQGGFVELQEITLYPMNSNVEIDAVKKVILNEENYDPAIAKEKAGQGIYITPQKGSFKPGSQKLKPVKLKSASIVKPNAPYTVIKDNGFEEQIVDSIKGNNAVELVVPPSLEVEKAAPNAGSPLIEEVVPSVKREIVENLSVAPSVLNVTPTWVLQFASYKNKDNALLDLNAFQTRFADQELTVVEDMGWFKVIKPGFKSADKASLMGLLIKDKYGADSFVTQISLPVNTTAGEQGSIEMAKPDAKFSIQLAAIQNENLAIEIIKKMPKGYDYFTAKKDDKTLVLLGMFSTKQDALKLSKTLDESIQNNMWIRTLTGISNISSVIK